MKALALIVAASLGVGTAALAQQATVRGEASAESQTSVSADRNGANVASDNRAQGGVAVVFRSAVHTRVEGDGFP